MTTLRHILLDARFGLRLLRRRLVFTATLLGVLVLGIGATTAMFSIVMDLLFVLGGGGGAILARWLVDVFASGLASGAARAIPVHVDASGLAFAIGVATLSGLAFGLLPALEASSVSPQVALNESAARGSMARSARAARASLVVAQVALAFALLAAAGLTLRSYARVLGVPLGLSPEDLVTARLVLPRDRYASDARLLAFHRDLLQVVALRPGVSSVATNTGMPMGDGGWNGSFSIEGRPPWQRGNKPLLERSVVSPGYFETLRIPILRGRDLVLADDANGRRVVVINQRAAELFFPGENPIGKRIDIGGDPAPGSPWGRETSDDETVWREIVGVVGDVRQWGPGEPVRPECYAPMAQHPMRSFTIAIRSSRPLATLHELPGAVATIDPEQAIAYPARMTERVARMTGARRFLATLLGAFAGVALVLATLGVFGLVSYTTSQRTRELGIRIALGATPGRVLAAVMRDGVRLLAVGLGLGAVAALIAGRLVGRMTDGGAFDPVVFVTIGAVLFVAGLLASLLPGLRAVRIPPATALRAE